MSRLLTLVVVFCCADLAMGEPVVTIRDNGPNENRLNLVILGDGYTRNDLLKYSTDVDLLIAGIFRQEPYASYANYFNIHRIDVVSNESGIDHPESEIMRDTALGGQYNCGGSARRVCIDFVAVTEVLARSVEANARDLVLVLVNDAAYGGSGGRYSVASTHSLSVELMLHEMGHTLGLLVDEYSGGGTCHADIEPPAVNSTREMAREATKWNYWIDDATPVPTTTTTAGVPGLYVGSFFCADGVYRPTHNSKMRSLTRPFDQINSEQLIKRIYNFVSPVDSVTPPAGAIGPIAGSFDFLVRTPQPVDRELSVRWFIDGTPVGTNRALRLDTSTLELGSHVVELEARDSNPAVRRDPQQALVERVRWTFSVSR